jgi:hypothetical protein
MLKKIPQVLTRTQRFSFGWVRQFGEYLGKKGRYAAWIIMMGWGMFCGVAKSDVVVNVPTEWSGWKLTVVSAWDLNQINPSAEASCQKLTVASGGKVEGCQIKYITLNGIPITTPMSVRQWLAKNEAGIIIAAFKDGENAKIGKSLQGGVTAEALIQSVNVPEAMMNVDMVEFMNHNVRLTVNKLGANKYSLDINFS